MNPTLLAQTLPGAIISSIGAIQTPDLSFTLWERVRPYDYLDLEKENLRTRFTSSEALEESVRALYSPTELQPAASK